MTIHYRWLIAGAVIAAALAVIWAVLAMALLALWPSARSPEPPSYSDHARLAQPPPTRLVPEPTVTIHAQLMPMISKPHPESPPPKPGIPAG